jgi:ribosomal protein S18 acetylase RimI-like enzyme
MMGINALTINLVRQPTKAQLVVVENIYTVSFPPEERVDFASISADIRAGQHELHLVSQGRTPIGFAYIATLHSSQVSFGEYIAIAPEYRDRKIGSSLLQYLWATLRERNILGFVFEVEPEDEGTKEERSLRKRRIGFYQRNGADLVNCAPAYEMPNLSGTGSLRMSLMWIALAGGPQELRGELLRSCIRDIYVQIYDRGPNDSLLQGVLAHLVC